MSRLQKNAKQLQDYAKEMNIALRSSVAVGLPRSKAGSKVYGDGLSVVQVGVWHEYGFGNNPQRSWLRMSFSMKSDDLVKAIDQAWENVFKGRWKAKQALGFVGIQAQDIAQGAFETDGYGRWDPVTSSHQAQKGSGKNQTLVDTALLKNSITWVVR